MTIYEKIKNLTSDPFLLLYYDKEEADEIEKEGIKKDALEQGLERGLTQGRTDERKKIIRNMINKGMSVEQISEYMDLSVKQINHFLNS